MCLVCKFCLKYTGWIPQSEMTEFYGLPEESYVCLRCWEENVIGAFPTVPYPDIFIEWELKWS